MTTLVATALLVCITSQGVPQMQDAQVGTVKMYSSGVFERVLKVRARQGYAVRYDVSGYAARTDCSEIGSLIWLKVGEYPAQLLQVMDCSHPRDRARHVRENLIAEVDFKTAVRTGISKRGRGTALIWKAE